MINIAIIGLGARGGEVYGDYIKQHPELARVVAIADPNPEKRVKYQTLFDLDDSCVFDSGASLLQAKPEVQAVIIASPDQSHHVDALKAIESGYDLLLEKPIATTLEACLEIRDAAVRNHRRVVLCHVLRYAPLYRKIKDILDEKIIGDIVLMHQIEHIGYWHFAHSFVRGNWRNSQTSAPIVLAKTSHDLDIILWYMGVDVDSVSSFGGLYHFHPKHAPSNAPSHCIKGCPIKNTCPYDAEKIYMNNFKAYPLEHNKVWPFTVLDVNPTESSLNKALLGPYGRCVYLCDNDVMDHQLVNIAFKNGSHAHLTLSAFSGSTHRQIKIMGTKGEINADDLTQVITVKTYDGRFDVTPVIYDIRKMSESLKGHGGGDERMMYDFLTGLSSSEKTSISSSIEHTVTSHVLAFKAEESRCHQGTRITMNEEDTR